jgi:GNAT superfamily N-acetyltransferase
MSAQGHHEDLLAVPGGYGGYGLFLDAGAAHQVQELIDLCREELRVADGRAPASDAAARVLAFRPPAPGTHRRVLVGLYDGDGRMSALLDAYRDRSERGEWWITHLLVRPDLRGCGIAASLVEALEGCARADGAAAIHLRVARGPAARWFALRAGFVALSDEARPTYLTRLLR